MRIMLWQLPLVLPTSSPIPRVLGCGLTSHFGELKIPVYPDRATVPGLGYNKLNFYAPGLKGPPGASSVWIVRLSVPVSAKLHGTS